MRTRCRPRSRGVRLGCSGEPLGDVAELLALGVARHAARGHARALPGGARGRRRATLRWRRCAPRVDEWCARLAALPVPAGLDHNDLHHENVLAGPRFPRTGATASSRTPSRSGSCRSGCCGAVRGEAAVADARATPISMPSPTSARATSSPTLEPRAASRRSRARDLGARGARGGPRGRWRRCSSPRVSRALVVARRSRCCSRSWPATSRAAVDSDQFANRATAALRGDAVRTRSRTGSPTSIVLAKAGDLIAARPIIESVASASWAAGIHRSVPRGVRDVHARCSTATRTR